MTSSKKSINLGYYFLLTTLLSCISCANYNQHLAKSEQDWQNRQLPDGVPRIAR